MMHSQLFLFYLNWNKSSISAQPLQTYSVRHFTTRLPVSSVFQVSNVVMCLPRFVPIKTHPGSVAGPGSV